MVYDEEAVGEICDIRIHFNSTISENKDWFRVVVQEHLRRVARLINVSNDVLKATMCSVDQLLKYSSGTGHSFQVY